MSMSGGHNPYVYSDSDSAGDVHTRKSAVKYTFKYDGVLAAWQSFKNVMLQPHLQRRSTSHYRSVDKIFNIIAEYYGD